MKNILCYGDSNTWGNIAGSYNPELLLAKRYEYDVRWTGVLQQLLGSNFHIIEAGLNARNTSFDEAIVRPSRNGLATLPGILEMHYPLDLVIFKLGTNDTRIEFNATPEQITQGMKKLVQFVKSSHFGQNYQTPKVLLVSPVPIFRVSATSFDVYFDDSSINKSQQLAKYYAQLAEEEHCHFLDAGPIVKVSPDDGVHIEKNSHLELAKAMAQKIKEIKL